MNIVYLTPKAASRLTDEAKAAMAKFGSYRLQPTAEIYANMVAGWTEEQCDAVAYIQAPGGLPCAHLTLQDAPGRAIEP